MKLSILQENLNKGFSIVSRIINPKSTLPILTNILLSVEEGKLKLSTTNLETSINIWMPAKKDQAGQFTIPAKDLTEFISSLPAGKVELEKKEEKLYLASGRYKAVFNGMAAVDFPKIPSLRNKNKTKNLKKVELEIEKFTEAVNEVCFSAAIDETRPVLTGVRVSCQDKKLQLVATDGYRLSLKTIKLAKKIDIPVLIIPARALTELVKIIESEEKEGKKLELALTKDKNQIIFSFNNIELVARLIEGEFPQFSKIIPDAGETKVLIDKDEFNQAVRAASIFARKSANIVKLKIENSKLKITANAPEVGENEIELEIKNQGPDVEIAFNYRFLQDFLSSFRQEAFSLELSGSLKPGLFKTEKDSSFLHVIMPVRLQE